MRRLINILSVLIIIFAFLVFDYHLINKVFAVSAPSAVTSWVRALPLQPTKRSVYVGWNGVNDAAFSKYYLQCANSPFSANTPTSFVVIYNGTALNYIHNNLSDNYWYSYRVIASNTSGVNSTWSPAHGVAIQPAGLKWEETY